MSREPWMPCEVFAFVPHAWSLPKSFERIEQFFNPPVCGVDTVRSNVLPDLVSIEICVHAEDVAAHA